MTFQEEVTRIKFDEDESATIKGVLEHVTELLNQKGWKCSFDNKPLSKKDMYENITRYRQLISKIQWKDEIELDGLELDTIRGAMLV
jgi:hypothetical protein